MQRQLMRLRLWNLLLGWKEYEMEVVRDTKDNCIIICSIENLDPMGIHTGDSITVAPAQTLTDKEYQRMRDASLRSEEHTSELQSQSTISYAVFCMKKKTDNLRNVENVATVNLK